MFDKNFIFIPFGISRFKRNCGNGYIGYTDYRIFGVRVARVQETRPWS